MLQRLGHLSVTFALTLTNNNYMINNVVGRIDIRVHFFFVIDGLEKAVK